jgi:hypothetical protein
LKISEKMTDVSVATAMLVDAFTDKFDAAFLISGDSDLAPPIQAIRNYFTNKRVIVIFPPKRIPERVDLFIDIFYHCFLFVFPYAGVVKLCKKCGSERYIKNGIVAENCDMNAKIVTTTFEKATIEPKNRSQETLCILLYSMAKGSFRMLGRILDTRITLSYTLDSDVRKIIARTCCFRRDCREGV